MIPVWINIRKERFPMVPAIAQQDWELMLVGDRKVTHPYFYFYYIRSFALSPDLSTLLNSEEGRWGQISASKAEYLDMLRASVRRYRERSLAMK